MPLTTLPDQGIEVPLSEYNRLRAFQGGGWFWDHDNQQVIREVLGDFLPRVEERRDRGGALFQHFIGATETASRSQAVGTQMNRVPRGEYQRLQRALDNLKRKAQNPNTDPNARKIIEKFCLPDPAKDSELYRLYGSGWNRRLLVLWGCEREEGTSLAPVAALSKISVEAPATTFFRRLPIYLAWLLLLLLLIAAGVWWWQRHTAEQRPDAGSPSNLVAGSVNDSGNPVQPRTTTPAGTPAANAVGVGNGTAATDQQPGMAATATSEAAKAVVSSQGAAANSSAETASNTARTNRSDNADVRDSAQSTDSSVSAHGTEAANAAANPSKAGLAGTTTPGQSASSSARDSSVEKAADSHHAVGEKSSAADPQNSAAVSPSKPTPANSPATGNDHPRAGDVAPAAAAHGAPAKVEILKAQSSSTPHDGKMDMVLMAAAHEGDGSSAPVEVTRWTVDDVPQQDRAGHDVTTGQLNLSLPAGKHHVGLSATVHGATVETDTDMEVLIKSQGDVTLKPREVK